MPFGSSGWSACGGSTAPNRRAAAIRKLFTRHLSKARPLSRSTPTFPSDFTVEMRDARIIAPDRLAFTTSSSAVVLLMRDGRLRTLDSRDTKTGEVAIKDGFYAIPAGAPTLLFERCEA